MNWRWIDKRALLLLHAQSLAEHGGRAGMRNEPLLDSALASPQSMAGYDDPDCAELAASYGVGIARNRPFVDANKRTAFLAATMFLSLNGYRLTAAPADAAVIVYALAGDAVDKMGLADWLRRNSAPR
ncbi:MAG TPA: type II toxin-antitoxin system death-on-curing family toxin [Burkholderiales bacterium]|nr:type II toxin-antitoxin system death-on-curing family toxin [Burkholderiales bacterium]